MITQTNLKSTPTSSSTSVPPDNPNKEKKRKKERVKKKNERKKKKIEGELSPNCALCGKTVSNKKNNHN